MKRRGFFNELTPLANKLRDMARRAPAPLSVAKDYHACVAKRAAKLARRAARVAKQVSP